MSSTPTPSPTPSSSEGDNVLSRAWKWLSEREEHGRQGLIFQRQNELARENLRTARTLDHELLQLRNDYDARTPAAADPLDTVMETDGQTEVQDFIVAVNELAALIQEHRLPANQTTAWWTANSHRYIRFRNMTFPGAVRRIAALPHWGRRMDPSNVSSPTFPRALQDCLASLEGLINETTGDFPGRFASLEGFLVQVGDVVSLMETAAMMRRVTVDDDDPNTINPPHGQRFIDWATAMDTLTQNLNELELLNRDDLKGADTQTIAQLAAGLMGRIRRQIRPVDRAAAGTVTVENLDEISADLGMLILQLNRHINRPLPEGLVLAEHAEEANRHVRVVRHRIYGALAAVAAIAGTWLFWPSKSEPTKPAPPAPIVSPKSDGKAPDAVLAGSEIVTDLKTLRLRRDGDSIKTEIAAELVGNFYYEMNRPGFQPIKVQPIKNIHELRIPMGWEKAADITITVYHRFEDSWYRLDPAPVPAK